MRFTMPLRKAVPALLVALAVTAAPVAPAGAASVSADQSSAARTQAAKTARAVTMGVGTHNVLGWHHTIRGGKNAGMRDGVWRAKQSVRVWNRHNLDIVGLQELETPQATVINAKRAWNVVRARPNNYLRGSNTMGNGIAYRSTRWQLLDTEDLYVPMRGRSLGLNMATALLANKATGARVGVISFHNPRTGGLEDAVISRETQALAKEMEARYAQRIAATGIPVLLVGDSNEGTSSQWFASRGLTNGAAPSIDVLMGANLRFSSSSHVRAGVLGVLTDHPLVTARAHVPAGVPMIGSLPSTAGLV